MRFDRDRRGYETTAVTETGRRGRGKRLLYWFRTPPGVRVGRAPIDETAIRLLEQYNPDVQFDWTRILKAPSPAESQPRREGRDRDRDQRGRREPRQQPQRSRSSGGPPAAAVPAPPPPRAAASVTDALQQENRSSGGPEFVPSVEQATASDQETTSSVASDLPSSPESGAKTVGEAPPDEGTPAFASREPVEPVEPRDPIEPREPREPPVFDPRPEDLGSASYQRLGAEGLVRLRARYAEVMARITERPLEEEAREELKQRAERLNPDAWVTADEVTAALEQYETVFESLRGVVGRHPRGRRRGRG